MRSDIPRRDEQLRVNLTWRHGGSGLGREPVGIPSAKVAALLRGPELEVAGRLLE